jgi:hypothetical protein
MITRRKLIKTYSIAFVAQPLLNGAKVFSFAGEDCLNTQGLRSFAFYQGLGANETRSPQRPDGTYSKMPCLTAEDIEAAQTKIYTFWHGHNNEMHSFELGEMDFLALQEGKIIEIYTSIVTGHRHALRIDPNDMCGIK